jgi:hypothetical protein
VKEEKMNTSEISFEEAEKMALISGNINDESQSKQVGPCTDCPNDIDCSDQGCCDIKG